MTHTTEQDRAEFEATLRKIWIVGNRFLEFTGVEYSKEEAQRMWLLWQAARRAPVVPDQSIIEAVDGWFARNTALGGCSDKDVAELAAIFAAAPQPPEAAQLDDINVADMHQVFVLKGEE